MEDGYVPEEDKKKDNQKKKLARGIMQKHVQMEDSEASKVPNRLKQLTEIVREPAKTITEIANRVGGNWLPQEFKDHVAQIAIREYAEALPLAANKLKLDVNQVKVNEVFLVNLVLSVADRESDRGPHLKTIDQWHMAPRTKVAPQAEMLFTLGRIERSATKDVSRFEYTLAEMSEKVVEDSVGLKGGKELADKNWFCCNVPVPEGGVVNIYCAEGTFSSADEMKRWMGGLIWIDRDVRAMFGKKDYVAGDSSFIVFKDRQNLPRAFQKKGFSTTTVDVALDVATHEKIHEEMERRFGGNMSNVNSLVEGTAVYFAHQEFPKGGKNIPETLIGYREVLQIISKSAEEDVIRSHHDVAEKIGSSIPVGPQEFSYANGVVMVGYMVEKYGVDQFLEIYKNTVPPKDEEVDLEAFDPYKKDDVDEVKILEDAIRKAGIDVKDFRKGLKEYARQKLSQTRPL